MGIPSTRHQLQPKNNRYKNPFGTEIALLRTSEGGMARMAVSWDTPGSEGENGRVRGQQGSMVGMKYSGDNKDAKLPNIERPPLPPTVAPGGHNGSHGHLTEEFIRAILEDRQPQVDIVMALNMTVAGIVSHESVLEGGRTSENPPIQFVEGRLMPCQSQELRSAEGWKMVMLHGNQGGLPCRSSISFDFS